LAFPGSETVGPQTCVLDGPDIVNGLRRRGYRTICIGGVGFFNPQTSLGRVFPGLFDESHWAVELGVADPHSFEHQIELVREALRRLSPSELAFLFVNVSALHQPNCIFSRGATEDSPETQADALAYVDFHFRDLIETLTAVGPWHAIVCSDHG